MQGEKDQDRRIAAKPGTPEYQRQFDRQALRAADAALRLGIVRVGCGAVALAMFVMMFMSAMDMRDHGGWTRVWMLVFSFVFFVETAHVALRGSSVFLRFVLSSVSRKRPRICDVRMDSGSRNFAGFRRSCDWHAIRNQVELLPGAVVTAALCDYMMEGFVDFRFRGEEFSVHGQVDDCWFFVANPDCDEEILLEVAEHLERLLGSESSG